MRRFATEIAPKIQAKVKAPSNPESTALTAASVTPPSMIIVIHQRTVSGRGELRKIFEASLRHQPEATKTMTGNTTFETEA